MTFFTLDVSRNERLAAEPASSEEEELRSHWEARASLTSGNRGTLHASDKGARSLLWRSGTGNQVLK